MKKDFLIDKLKAQVQANIDVSRELAEKHLILILDIALKIANVVKNGNKIILCGNGGSAADSQHIAAEFINRFRKNRDPLPAIALTTDTSVLTSIGNDFGFEYIFSKQIAALGSKGDVLIAISTSGKAKNVINAVDKAKQKGVYTIGLTGDGGGDLKNIVDICLKVPSHDTATIQQAHILIGHLLCEIIEEVLFAS